MATASEPPGVPTPTCRIEVVKAAISPSLTGKSRDVFPQELPHLDGPYFLGVNVLLVTRDAVFLGCQQWLLALPSTNESTRRRRNASWSGLFLSSGTSSAC